MFNECLLTDFCRTPYEFMCQVERKAENALRELRLPSEIRMRKRTQDWKKLQSFENSVKVGSISVTRQKIDQETDKLVAELSEYLKSKEAAGYAWKHITRSAIATTENAKVLEVANYCLFEAITSFRGYRNICKWADTTLQQEVQEVIRTFNVLQADVGLQQPFIPDVKVDLKSPWWVCFCSVLGRMAGIVGRTFKELAFKGNVKQAYDQMTSTLTTPSGLEDLKEIVRQILSESCDVIQVVAKDLPDQMRNLSSELEARVKQEEKNIPLYKPFLNKCGIVTGKMSKFMLELKMHLYRAGVDISWPEPRVPVGYGSFGDVYKVTVPGKGEAALKMMREPLTDDNSRGFMKELESCR